MESWTRRFAHAYSWDMDIDEFGYRLWNLEEKKVIQSRDIVFMEGKTIAEWESEKRKTSSESTDRNQLEETRVYVDGNWIVAG